MKLAEQIEHKGIVKKIHPRKIDISIIAMSACASCNLKGACTVSDVEEKIIEVKIDNPGHYKTGEEVNIFFKRSLGFRALFLGYIFPFLILLFTLIFSSSITGNELLSGILAVTVLIPYYVILYLQKDKIKNTFRFSVEKSSRIKSYNLAKI